MPFPEPDSNTGFSALKVPHIASYATQAFIPRIPLDEAMVREEVSRAEGG